MKPFYKTIRKGELNRTCGQHYITTGIKIMSPFPLLTLESKVTIIIRPVNCST